MNFQNLRSATLTFTLGILLSIFAKDNLAYGGVDRNKNNQYKSTVIIGDVIGDRSISHVLIGGRIISKFSPKDNQGKPIELNKLAYELGYDHFNWVSYVETDPHGITDSSGIILTTPYNDPPQGGYRYDRADRFPFYWDVVNCDRCKQRHHFLNHNNSQPFNLVFEDAPADYRLKSDEAIEFITSLVGVKEINLETNRAEWEIIHTFRWKLANPRPNFSQVSLTDANVSLKAISPQLIDTMVLDGASFPSSQAVSNSR